MHSRFVELDGPTHYVDFGYADLGESQGRRARPIVYVHGLGGSHLNFMTVAGPLSAEGPSFALDLIGHGRTRTEGRGADISSNVKLLGRFLDEVVGEPAILVGNSMGGLVSFTLAHEQPERVAGLVLVSAAQPIVPFAPVDFRAVGGLLGAALPFVGPWLMRRRAKEGPAALVRQLLAICCVDSGRIPADAMEAHMALAVERAAWGDENGRAFVEAVRSVVSILLRRGTYFGHARQIKAPTLVVHGQRDRVVNIACSRALVKARPDFRLVEFEDTGHVPQLEAGERFVETVREFARAL